MRARRPARAPAARAPACGGAAGAGGFVLLALVLAGCAGVAPAPAAAPTTAPHAVTPAAPPAAAAAVVDSSPSPEALAVLSRIPEPLPESERVPPPAGVRAAGSTVAPAGPSSPGAAPGAAAAAGGAVLAAARDGAAGGNLAGGDSASAAAPESTGTVPVPSPTLPLGDRAAAGEQALPESALVPRIPPPAASKPDTCWRLQVGAPPEKEKAQSLMKVASSQLLTTFVIEHEKGRYKVRSSDCLSRAGAESLRQRSVRSGFKGAFLVAVPAKGKKS